MRLSFIIAAVIGSALAFPVTDNEVDVAGTQFPPENEGATIWKQQYRKGQYLATDYTVIPAPAMCVDMDNIYGGWERSTRSLKVNPGFKCRFYTELGCKGGKVLVLGEKDTCVDKDVLPKDFDRSIQSIICDRL